MKALLVTRNIAIVATLLTFSTPEPARAEDGCILTSQNCVLCAFGGCALIDCGPGTPIEVVC